MAPALPTVRAAGGLVWRERDGRLEVRVIHRPRYRDWSWPKGKLDPGESLPACAVREVAEETGDAVVLGPPLPGIRYRTGDGRRKEVHYWAMRVATSDDGAALAARAPVTPATEAEVDDVVWVRASTARDLLTRKDDRVPLERLERLWSTGRLDTRLLAVVRHGAAVPRKQWSGADADRPLTASGTAQAAGLVDALAAFGVRQVVTSPWERCVRTGEPYVRASGAPTTSVEALSQGAYRLDAEPALAVVRRHLLEPDDAAVVTHRPVLAGVTAVLQDAARRWTDGRVPRKNPYLAAGEVLVAHVRATPGRARLVAVERHQAPTP